MKKKTICILLVLALTLCLFAGCTKTEAPASAPAAEEPAPAAEPAAEPAPEPAAEPAAESAPEATDAPAGEPAPQETAAANWTLETGTVAYDLPLFEETLELSVYWVLLGNQPEKTALPFWDRVQENLNVGLTFKQISETTCSEQYNLMIAAGDMTDLIWEDNCSGYGTSSVYPNGYDAAIEDEIYVELTDLLPEYAPNYWNVLTHYDAAKKDLTTDTGKLYSVSMLYSEPQGPRFGMLVRQDYMDATGMAVPEDTDGWLEVMRAMKANGVVYPYGAQSTADVMGFIDAFGTTATSSLKVDLATNTLVYDGTSQEMRDYLEYFRILWQEQLVSPDFINVTIFDSSMQTDGTNAIYAGMPDSISSFKRNYDIDLFAPEPPYLTGNPAQEQKITNYEQTVQMTSGKKNMVISTNCTQPEDALKFLDWFYSAAGIQACNYGFVEGESYEIVDGQIQALPLMGEKSEEGYNNELVYALDEGPMIYLLDRYYSIKDPGVIEVKDMWCDIDMSAVAFTTIPTIMLTVEEADAVTSRRSDIDTFATTQIMKWETCQDELNDETWAAFCATIEDMGLEEILATYNAAYARYVSR